MIIRDRPSAVRLLLTLRGSILGDIWKPLLFSIAVATVITLVGGRILGVKVHLDVAPFTLIGMTLAIFLGFRNNVCYDRYWEARRLWGDLAVACRIPRRTHLDRAGHRVPGPLVRAVADDAHSPNHATFARVSRISSDAKATVR